MTTERIDIVVREDGSRVVKRNLKDIGDEADSVADSLDILKTALIGVVAAFSFSKFAQITGVWTDLNSRVARFAGTAKGTEVIMNRLMTVAQRTYAPLESIADIYLENAFALDQLGKTTEETLDYTEALTNALVVSGAKGDRQASVIAAMSKAMLEGKLAGDNWNTVLTTGGRVVEALVQETGKSLVELKEMAKAGQLTSDTVFTALLDQLETLREEADDMPATIGDAFIRMQNRILQVVGELDAKLGASSAVVKMIDFVTKNLETLIPVVAGLGVAIAVALSPMVVLQFIGVMKTLFALLLANPFTALAAAIAGVLTYLYMMRDEIKLGVDDTTTLGDLMRAVWEGVSEAISTVAEVAKNVFGFITETMKESVTLWTGLTFDSVEKQESLWLRIPRTVAQVFDMIAGTVRGTFLGIYDVAKLIIGEMINSFKRLGEVASAAMRGDFAAVGEVLSKQEASVGDIGARVGAAFADRFRQEVLSQDKNGLESVLDGLVKRAQEIGKERSGGEGFTGFKKPGGTGGGVGEVDKDAAKKAKQLADALNDLLNKVNPIRAAEQELAKAEETLTKAVAAGLIKREEANNVYAKFKDMLKEQLQPYEFMMEQMKEEAELAKLIGAEREIEINVRNRVNQLMDAGVDVTKEMTDALRAQLIVEQELNRIGQMKENLMANSQAGDMGQFNTMLSAIEQLTADAGSGFGMVDGFNAANEALGGLLSNTTQGMEAQMEAFDLMHVKINELQASTIISEQTASQARMAIWQMEWDAKTAATANALGVVAGLMNTNNKKAFAIGKAAAIAQATITSITTAMEVYKSAAAIPYVGWILGPVAAAAALAAGAANISKIRAQQMPAYRTGGSMVVGGHGGVDSQTVALRATPGERININTPAQARALERTGDQQDGGDRVFNSSVTIVQQGRPNRWTSEQEARKLTKTQRKQFERNN